MSMTRDEVVRSLLHDWCSHSNEGVGTKQGQFIPFDVLHHKGSRVTVESQLFWVPLWLRANGVRARDKATEYERNTSMAARFEGEICWVLVGLVWQRGEG